MLRGLNPKTLLNDYHEWHALVIGFCEVVCPWPPQHQLMSQEDTKTVADEYHYYVFGRALGVLALVGLAELVKLIVT